MLKIKMDKTTKQVTKDLRRQDCGKKSYETYMKKLNADIRKENLLFIPFLQIILHLLRVALQLLPRSLLITIPLYPEILIYMALV